MSFRWSCAWLALMMLTVQTGSAFAQNAVALDTYKCSEFLSDVATPTDGAALVRSLMMIAWATGYASGFQKGTKAPRADAKSVQIMSALLGESCRRHSGATAVNALIDSLGEFAKAKK
jgi:hypothetical protein